jgi:DNA-binding protein HU-beta
LTQGFPPCYKVVAYFPNLNKGNSVNKSELIARLVQSAHISKHEAALALDVTLTSVRSALRKGEEVKLVGFGTFYVGKRAARKGFNPRTGETIKVKSCKLPKFRASERLRNALK